MLQQAATDAEADLRSVFPSFGASVRDAQLRQAIAALHDTLGYFWTRVGDTVSAREAEAAEAAIAQSFSWDDRIMRRAYPDKAVREHALKSISQTAAFNVEAAIARVYKSHIPLSRQVYKTRALANGWVDTRVGSALARGLTVKELADEVRQFILPNTPGGVSYAARRLGRTEINNAYHAVTIEHHIDKPWVNSMRWRLSGSHPKVDICDAYAAAGPYAPDEVPAKAHPQCLCVVYPDLPSVEEFMERLNRGEYREWINSHY